MNEKDISANTLVLLVEQYFSERVEPISKVPNPVQDQLNNIGAEFSQRKVIDITRVMLADIYKFQQKHRQNESGKK